MTELEQIENMHLWAWVGPDDVTYSGVVGIKIGITPAGAIPLVACIEDKMKQRYIREGNRAMVKLRNEKRYLVRFRFEAIEEVIENATH